MANNSDCHQGKKEHHILALSGGKDSAALAVYMRDRYPDLDLGMYLQTAAVNYRNL